MRVLTAKIFWVTGDCAAMRLWLRRTPCTVEKAIELNITELKDGKMYYR